jgi:TPR repeat protein
MTTTTTTKMSCKVLAGAAMAILMSMTLSAPALASDQEYEAGLVAAGEHRYAQALSHFQAAAVQGDRNAQRTSGLMLLYGERLYGAEVHADKLQAMKLLRAAAQSGCEVSARMLSQLQSTQGTHIALLSNTVSAQ